VDATLAALAEMIVGDALGKVALWQQLTVLGLLLGSGGWAALRPGRPAVVAFAACAALWWRANQALEGPVLWTLAPGHGVVLADLLPVALGIVVARRYRALRDADLIDTK
jgi:hypothetical protein